MEKKTKFKFLIKGPFSKPKLFIRLEYLVFLQDIGNLSNIEVPRIEGGMNATKLSKKEYPEFSSMAYTALSH